MRTKRKKEEEEDDKGEEEEEMNAVEEEEEAFILRAPQTRVGYEYSLSYFLDKIGGDK